MPITKGAKKTLRAEGRKWSMNQSRRKRLKSTVKAVLTGEVTDEKAAYKAIDKAAKRGIIKKNTAARKKSRIARTIAANKK